MQRARSWAVTRIVGWGLASVLFLEPLPAVAQLARSPVAAQDVSLVDAVRSGDRETITRLLESGLSASSAEPDGTAALHWASQRDDLSTVELLLAFGAEVDAPNRYGVTPLVLAATNGSPLVMEALIDAGASVNGVTSSGDTLLMVAARTGRVEVVEQLLAAGAAVDAKESWRGQTALMWAAAEGNVETIQALVRAGADLEARSEGQLTALLFAVREGRPDAVAALVAVGADVNAPARDGTAPLALAVINAHFDIGGQLLEAGADPNASDPRGSVLHSLSWVRRPGSGRPPLPTGDLDSLVLARMLLEHGADPNVWIDWEEIAFEVDLGVTRGPPGISVGRNFLSFVGATPFYLAAKHADVEYMRLLAEYGADPKIPTGQAVTPLMAAAGVGFWDGESPGPLNGTPETVRLEAVQLTLELGNDIHAVTDFGETALEGGSLELLLRHPPNLAEFDPQRDRGDMRWGGSTALHGAAMMGSNLIVQFLVERGARLYAENALGWTPRMVAEGVFVANTEKAWPETVALLSQLEARGH